MNKINEIIKNHQTSTPKFNFEEKQRDFKKLSELEKNKNYMILAVFINTQSKFGEQGVFVTQDYNVNLPQHLTNLVYSMRSDDDMVQAINEGAIGFNVYHYQTKNGRQGYSIRLVPLAEDLEDAF